MQRDGMSARVARGGLVAALFAAYPLALVRPVHTGSSLVFYLILPVFFWFSLICLAWLLATPAGGPGIAAAPGPAAWRGRLPALLTLGLVAWVAGDAFVHPGATLFDTVAALGAFAVPAWVALAPRRCLPRRLPLVLALVWTAGALHGLWQTRVGFEVVGLAGNRNWMACVMLALIPWVWLALTPRHQSGTLGGNPLKRVLPHPPFRNFLCWLRNPQATPPPGTSLVEPGAACGFRNETRKKVWKGVWGTTFPQKVFPKGARLVVGLAAVGLGLFLAWRAESRAAWLALAGYGLVFGVLPRFSWLGRGLLLLGLAGVLAAGAAAWPERVAQAVGDDIRLPLWAQTAQLVQDHPVGGCGPGLFRREFVAYKSSAQMERRVAATITEHPHNEPLNLAATLGLPAAVLWLALWWPLVRRPRGGWLAAAHFTAWMIFVQGWFDKTLVQPPTQVAGYLCLGLLWRPWLACRLQPARRPQVLRLAWGVAVAAALVLGLVAGGRRALASVWFRAASIAEAEQRFPEAVDDYARAARLCPEDPSAAMLAGALAGNRLRNPQLALEFLEKAWTREPDFAHVNGEIGAALGQLGRHADALPFLERDARLYPYDPQSWQRYLMCCLLTEKWTAAGAASGRLADLADRKLKNALGEGEARRRCCAFVLALQEGRMADAQAVAQELLRPTGSEWADPGLGDLPGGVAAARRLVQQRFGADDVHFWGQAWAARRAARQDVGGVAGGLVRTDAVTAGRLRQREGCWPVVAVDAAGGPRAERLAYPVVPLEFCGRTLVLGGLLKSELGALAPLQADPPTLNLARCRAAAAAAGVTGPVEFYLR